MLLQFIKLKDSMLHIRLYASLRFLSAEKSTVVTCFGIEMEFRSVNEIY